MLLHSHIENVSSKFVLYNTGKFRNYMKFIGILMMYKYTDVCDIKKCVWCMTNCTFMHTPLIVCTKIMPRCRVLVVEYPLYVYVYSYNQST